MMNGQGTNVQGANKGAMSMMERQAQAAKEAASASHSCGAKNEVPPVVLTPIVPAGQMSASPEGPAGS